MATVKCNEWLAGMLGNPTTSVVDMDTNDMELSLLDQTDSGTITATTLVYDTVDAATVVANVDIEITVAAGVASSAGATFTAVTGDAADYLTLWKNSATPSTSPLVITWDSATTGLPLTPNGGNVVVTFGSNVVVTLA